MNCSCSRSLFHQRLNNNVEEDSTCNIMPRPLDDTLDHGFSARKIGVVILDDEGSPLDNPAVVNGEYCSKWQVETAAPRATVNKVIHDVLVGPAGWRRCLGFHVELTARRPVRLGWHCPHS